MTNKTLAAGLFAATTFFSGGAFAATELITNGGFEDSMTDWACVGSALCQSITSGANGSPYSGSYFMSGQNGFGGMNGISQTISTVAGETYDFSFWSYAPHLTGNTLSYSLDGGAVVSALTTTTYAQTMGSFVASGSTAVIDLYFGTSIGTGKWRIDDVSVSLASVATPAVPLPAGLPLALSGLAALGLLRRKSRGTTTV